MTTLVYSYQPSSHFTQVTSKRNKQWYYNYCGYSLPCHSSSDRHPIASPAGQGVCIMLIRAYLCILDIHQKYNVGHWNCNYMCMRSFMNVQLWRWKEQSHRRIWHTVYIKRRKALCVVFLVNLPVYGIFLPVPPTSTHDLRGIPLTTWTFPPIQLLKNIRRDDQVTLKNREGDRFPLQQR